MMQVLPSKYFGGWVICEVRQIENRIKKIPISLPYGTEDEAVKAMHEIYMMQQEVL